MSVLQWMDIIYPADVALFLGYLIAKGTYLVIVRRSLAVMSVRMTRLIRLIILHDWLLGLTETIVVYLLAQTTDKYPSLAIGEYRVYVAITRAGMGVVLLGCISAHLLAIYEFLFAHAQPRKSGVPWAWILGRLL